MTEQDEGLLTPRECRTEYHKWYDERIAWWKSKKDAPIPESLESRIAGIQYARDKQHYEQKIEELFKEIEKESYVEKHHPWGKDVYIDVRFIEEGKYQSLKDKYLGGSK